MAFSALASATQVQRQLSRLGTAPAGAAIDAGAALRRVSSSHGPDYDALIERGVPRRMVRRAWVVTGGRVPEAMAFIRSNFDQPLEFWDGDEPGALSRIRSNDTGASVLQRVVDRVMAGGAELQAAVGLCATDVAQLRQQAARQRPLAAAAAAAAATTNAWLAGPPAVSEPEPEAPAAAVEAPLPLELATVGKQTPASFVSSLLAGDWLDLNLAEVVADHLEGERRPAPAPRPRARHAPTG